ncbi:hypothetical protein V502_04242 [Pseudogymnoascus sp. VKM F-4520 (FW-2644)]|nr:hypothetical protein V502_04242 [Pseudogymnoascus sp. VKM F-4520 (FW-2644)]
MCTLMSYDDVAWEKSDNVFDAWKHKLYRNDVLQTIGRFVQKHRGGVAIKLCNPLRGSFNEQDSTGDTMAIDPNITDEKLSCVYEQMADILLELSKCSFPEVGSLVETREFEYSVSETYIARHLFGKLATEHRLTSGDDKTFKLFCDDLGPHNILVDAEFKVVAVIDWEFAYSAPSKFSHTPPWWLLIQMPERWPKGLDSWAANYEKRLQLFLCCLEAREQVALEEGRTTKEDCLSREMRQNWENGDFQVHYAARKSWAVDAIYWSRIDERFFGPRDLLRAGSRFLTRGIEKG